MEHPYVITRLEHLLPVRGLPLVVNRPQHQNPTPFHDHDFIEIAVVRGSEAVHRGIHGERPVARGDVLVLHPGQWHGYGNCAAIDLTNLCLPVGLFAPELAWLAADPQVAALLPARGEPAQDFIHVHLNEAELTAIEAQLDRLQELVTAKAVRSRAEVIALTAAVLARLAAGLPRRHVAEAGDAVVIQLAAEMQADLARG